MRLLIIIIAGFLLCSSCGVKDDPKYQSQNNYNKKIKII
tara:strand:+ start:238 stop:354 length:117 start_codon:yes stop_codon:yes gene_type:complete